MQICLVGYGRWGKTYLKTIKKISSISVKAIVLKNVKFKIEGNYNFVYDLDQLLKEEKIDAVIIATPPDTHFELGQICLKHKVPLLIEKPFTKSYEESKLLQEEFNKNKILCMIGYQHLFSKKHKFLKKQTKKIGKIKNIYSISISDGPVRENVTVVRDWGSHEIAVALDLFRELPETVKIKKIIKNYTNCYKGLYNLKMKFPGNRYFISIFGNQSIIKKKQLIVRYNDGFVYQDNLCQLGNVTINENNLIDEEEILEIHPLPLELSLKHFQDKVCKNSTESNITLSVNVNKVLDQLESKILE